MNMTYLGTEITSFLFQRNVLKEMTDKVIKTNRQQNDLNGIIWFDPQPKKIVLNKNIKNKYDLLVEIQLDPVKTRLLLETEEMKILQKINKKTRRE